ncbi:Unknown protein, partial [Striga hermonthica]
GGARRQASCVRRRRAWAGVAHSQSTVAASSARYCAVAPASVQVRMSVGLGGGGQKGQPSSQYREDRTAAPARYPIMSNQHLRARSHVQVPVAVHGSARQRSAALGASAYSARQRQNINPYVRRTPTP